MLVSDVLLSLRFNLNDTKSVEFSDSELIEAINSTIRYINTALVNINSSIVQKKMTITPTNGSAKLPDDFIAVTSIEDENIEQSDFRIIGDTIYTDSTINMVYYYALSKVKVKTDTIQLPVNFFEPLIRFSEAIITKSMGRDAMTQLVYDEVSKATIGREYAYIEREIPFTI